MNKILIIGEHEGGKLNASIAKCVKCAQAIPGGSHVVQFPPYGLRNMNLLEKEGELGKQV